MGINTIFEITVEGEDEKGGREGKDRDGVESKGREFN